MAIHVALNHLTHYRFDRAVEIAPHVIRLRPAPHSRTPIESYSLNIKPKNHFINWQQDPFGNYLARVVFPDKAKELSIEVDLVANMTVINPFDFFVEEYAEHYPFNYTEQQRKELIPYLEIKEQGPKLQARLKQCDRSKQKIIDFLVNLNQQLQGEIFYNIRLEPGVQSCEETLTRASGSCRDSAWLLVQILRHLGIAARFVSGYLVQLTADVKSLDGPSGPEADFTDLHAWAEAYIPGAGWCGLDPTSGLFAGEGHIPLACTPDPVSAAPVTGATDPCQVEFSHHNTVQRIHEDPRVTKPYTEKQWQAIDSLGRLVDEELQQQDVRLTMGGEPTFVSIDDMEGAQWNTAALGEEKRKLAGELFQRLYKKFANGGMQQVGQGKWYPGEELPRWALRCYWRKDGKPIWQNDALIARDGADDGANLATTEQFARRLAASLGLPPQYLVPGYEDTLYYIWQEGKLPENVDPFKVELKDSLERQRLRQVLEQGLDQPVGFALPLRWSESQKAWQSGPWRFRRGRMFLTPGDSPMGLRLPLESLPWEAPAEREVEHPQSLFEPLPELGDDYGEVARRYSHLVEEEPEHPEVHEQAAEAGAKRGDSKPKMIKLPHTAICIEARDGQLHLFMPPLTRLEYYLELVATAEAVAEQLAIPLRLEGYPPPLDYRMRSFAITPDPGVIEVNIQPAHNWSELQAITNTIYEEARLSRLGTEKFMLDGRHTGTGGGNHVTLGGPTPGDSPMLRRPDLLRSLLTFWQHHPGLSYLFSGLFIGPTSQSPRVDEARHEAIYELEIAFQQIPEGEVPSPWLVDRLLRHLLVDVTGNTHRAEFCIDKLYSPDSDSGRLGLVEFRAFEMPPHARMSLVQMLLLRTLIAWFWQQPYVRPLVRWGTELHDRFMLPHFVWQDLHDVVGELNRAGYPFKLDWLAPFLEFRFPHYGTVHVGDLQLKLQSAIEPWHVLGEEVSAMGTARFVDSSVERLQVELNGLTDKRYILTCNGQRVPLHNTGRKGQYVAGVRFRAWQPPSALHPNIGVHAPLVFDIIDSWNDRSLGGCTYHVGHPGGRNYEVFPVNANEAETRRVSRFWDFGHSPGPLDDAGKLSVEDINPEYPYTLDLRRGGTSRPDSPERHVAETPSVKPSELEISDEPR